MAAPASEALEDFLNRRVDHEITTLDLDGATWPAGFTADAAIVKLDEAERTNGGKVTCTVALTLLDSMQSPVAIVRGHASVEGAASASSLSRDAVGGAARSAVAQLPNVFRQVNVK